MRYHPLWKALTFAVSIVLVLALCFGLFCSIFLLQTELYTEDPASLISNVKHYLTTKIAEQMAGRYAALQLSDVPEEVLPQVQALPTSESISHQLDLVPGSWSYEIRTAQGALLSGEGTVDSNSIGISCSVPYLMLTTPDQPYEFRYNSADQTYYFRYETSPHYLIRVSFQDDAITAAGGLPLSVVQLLHRHRYTLLVGMLLCLLALVGCIVYLCLAAAHSRNDPQLRPGGLNRLPLDLYGAVVGICGFFLLQATDAVLEIDSLFRFPGITTDPYLQLRLLLCGGLLMVTGVLVLGFLFAVAAQGKTPGRFWLRNTLVYRLLQLLLRWLIQLFRLFRKLYGLLPLIWQWLLAGSITVMLLCISLLEYMEGLFLFSLLLCAGLILYGAWCFGRLLEGAQKMGRGDLHAKVSGKYMVGAFRDFAVQLNQLSDAAALSAHRQMQSERMKTELITNVSHDIKTPLTSIISYADLLRTVQTPEQEAEYLDILEKQSLRLKKLIEDLTELSRASTGNLNPQIVTLDAAEALTQALGEFSDKFAASQLQLCSRIPETPVLIRADGRLLWRVLANLLSNTVKYALPGTRVYVELTANGAICIKNISREPLNISAQELTERFVRGDASRNTEGSGLGLSIAASLMEVQHGQLELRIDGDLFSATAQFEIAP